MVKCKGCEKKFPLNEMCGDVCEDCFEKIIDAEDADFEIYFSQKRKCAVCGGDLIKWRIDTIDGEKKAVCVKHQIPGKLTIVGRIKKRRDEMREWNKSQREKKSANKFKQQQKMKSDIQLIKSYFGAHKLEIYFQELHPNEDVNADLKYTGTPKAGDGGIVLTPSGVEILKIDFYSSIISVRYNAVELTKHINMYPIFLAAEPPKEIPKLMIDSMKALTDSINKNFPSDEKKKNQ